MDHEYFMRLAIIEAKKAYELKEVPVGAVVVKDDEVIATGYNRVETDRDATAHAELIAIKRASEILGAWRLTGCTLYVTLEPCAMCAGAMVYSRIDRLVFGAFDYKRGCAGTQINLLNFGPLNHKVEIVSAVLMDDCRNLLSSFFKEIRNE